MPDLSSESAVLESTLIHYASESGGTYIDPEEASCPRQVGASPLLWGTFIERLGPSILVSLIIWKQKTLSNASRAYDLPLKAISLSEDI